MFTAVTVITLAAGIGGNTVVFSVLEGVLLKPLPYPRTEELVGVWHNAPGLQITDLNMPFQLFYLSEQGKNAPGYRHVPARLRQRHGSRRA